MWKRNQSKMKKIKVLVILAVVALTLTSTPKAEASWNPIAYVSNVGYVLVNLVTGCRLSLNDPVTNCFYNVQ